ncbi:MAG: glycosyltransferase family 2 protein, partial [Pseudomonadota bacterium]
MSKPPKVSIIVAAYKAEAFLPTAIETCLAQSVSDLEVLIVDDASPISLEPTVKAAAGGDQRVRFLRLETNQGPSAARNLGLHHARGEFIAVLDADDLMASHRLQVLLTLAEQTGADIVADNLIVFRNQIDDLGAALYFQIAMTNSAIDISLSDLMMSNFGQFGNSLGYLKPVFRRSFLDSHGSRYPTDLRNSEDYYFLAELLAAGAQMKLCAEGLYYYRRHDASISHRISPEAADRVANAEARFRTNFGDTLAPRECVLSQRKERDALEMARFERMIAELKKRNPIGAT